MEHLEARVGHVMSYSITHNEPVRALALLVTGQHRVCLPSQLGSRIPSGTPGNPEMILVQSYTQSSINWLHAPWTSSCRHSLYIERCSGTHERISQFCCRLCITSNTNDATSKQCLWRVRLCCTIQEWSTQWKKSSHHKPIIVDEVDEAAAGLVPAVAGPPNAASITIVPIAKWCNMHPSIPSNKCFWNKK